MKPVGRRDGLQQRVKAIAVLRRNWKDVVRKLVKRRGERFLHLRIDFVGQNCQGFAGAAQQVRQLGVERREARADIDDQQKLRCAFDGHLRLAKNFARDGGLVVRHDSARVDDFERAALPGRGAVDAVARDSRLVGDNRAPRAGQPVENCRLPDIRAANDHYRWKLFSHRETQRTASERFGSFHCTVQYAETEARKVPAGDVHFPPDA